MLVLPSFSSVLFQLGDQAEICLVRTAKFKFGVRHPIYNHLSQIGKRGGIGAETENHTSVAASNFDYKQL